ncbi:MAG: ferritin family protein [Phycisphaerales bacterium]
MGVYFSVSAILQIAEEVERKAAGFYLAAAEQSCEEEPRNVHHMLASWRRRHQDTLSRLQREHSERIGRSDAFDSDDYVLSNPRVMAGLTWSGTSPLPRGHSIRKAGPVQILRDAIRRSKGIVIFYHGLKAFANAPDSLAMIDELIGTEDRHIRLIERVLEQMPTCPGDRREYSSSHSWNSGIHGDASSSLLAGMTG